jgi:hypothetical protein
LEDYYEQEPVVVLAARIADADYEEWKKDCHYLLEAYFLKAAHYSFRCDRDTHADFAMER